MNRTVSIALAVILAVPLLAVADEDRPSHRSPDRALHYIVAADRVLDTRELEADGIEELRIQVDPGEDIEVGVDDL